ncbi:hypothetical protein MLD38_001624 [Melastoma candidum]|uniref:Uncharacterized protein n=1 Tax=Melastoma candidum TaxID=119954 RepID=A0ACB9SE95_9MYRT|nr:hypothetical protein MLD38_001624 [Melastoma candidum]
MAVSRSPFPPTPESESESSLQNPFIPNPHTHKQTPANPVLEAVEFSKELLLSLPPPPPQRPFLSGIFCFLQAGPFCFNLCR